MKILLLITKGEIGGAQIFVSNLAKGIKDLSFEKNDVEIACGGGNFLGSFSQNNNIKFHNLKSLKRSFGFFDNINFFFDFINFLRKNKFDIVHLNSTNTLLGAISAKIVNRKIKTVFTVHGLSVLDPNYQASFFKKNIFRFFFNICFLFVDEVIFVSKSNFDFAKKNKLGKRISLIYNGVESNFLSKEDSRSFLFQKAKIIDSDCFLIGSIGRLAYPKNYEFLIENFDKILEIIPNAKLFLIGEGVERKKYEDIISRKFFKDSVFLLGEIFEASKYLKGFDLFVLPSIYEGLSISLIEALFSGIKVIASGVGGNGEIIGDNNCFELNNIDSFINLLKKNDNNYINRNKFLLEIMVNKYVDIYNK